MSIAGDFRRLKERKKGLEEEIARIEKGQNSPKVQAALNSEQYRLSSYNQNKGK